MIPDGAQPLQSSPGSQVWRVTHGGEPAVRKRLIGPAAEARFQRETTALRLAARADPPLAPAILAEDAAEATVVLEFLDAEPGLPDWIDYARALARLHALGDDGRLPVTVSAGTPDVDAFVRLCRGFGVPVTADVSDELMALAARLAAGPRTSLLHGDPCLGNVLVVDSEVRFIDFEQAGRGDGIAELSYLRIGFPTCGLTPHVPDDVIADAEAAYREAWRNAGGVGEPGSIVDHCVGWLLRGDALVQRAQRGRRDQFARLLAEDWDWGGTTARQRLVRRLGVVSGLAADDLPATAAAAAALRARLEA